MGFIWLCVTLFLKNWRHIAVSTRNRLLHVFLKRLDPLLTISSYFFGMCLIFSSHLRVDHSNGLFPSGLPINFSMYFTCASFMLCVCVCSVRLVFHDLIIVIAVEWCSSWNSLLYAYYHPSVRSRYFPQHHTLTKTDKKMYGQSVCVCVCVCVWEREREREREIKVALLRSFAFCSPVSVLW